MSQGRASAEQRLFQVLAGKQILGGEALFALGAELHQCASLEAALRAFELSADQAPERLAVWHAISALRLALHLPQAALQACNEALRRDPGGADSLFNAAVALEALGELDAARHAYQRVLDAEAGHFAARLNLVPLLARLQLLAEAVDAGQQLVEWHPSSADAWFNLGEALTSASRHREALAAYERALACDPSLVKADLAAAVSLAALGEVAASSARLARVKARHPAALAGFASPLLTDRFAAFPELEPGRIALIAAYEKYRTCDWEAAGELTRRFGEVIDGRGCRPLDNPDLPFLGIGLPLRGEQRLKAARQVAARVQAGVAGQHLVAPPRRKSDRLRIGYVSGDFRSHATSFLASRLFALHDRARFEVFAYSTGPDDRSAIRREIAAGCDSFVDVARFDPLALAQRIALDRIDILVDLAGYTLHSRPATLALRPAPIQVSYLAYLQTSGAPWIDYVLLDRRVLTEAERTHWSESIAYLPHTLYICDDRSDGEGKGVSRDDFALPPDRFVFASLNASWKVGEVDFSLWMEILRAVPESVLLIYADSPAITANLSFAAAQAGIDAGRLFFTGQLDHEAHQRRFQVADLFLDTRECNAHTTAIEALAAGLPVLTQPGTSVPGRVGASLLAAHGMGELVAESAEQYVAKAVRFATDAGWRDELRRAVRRREGSALFCTERRVREIERAYETMWAKRSSGQTPADFLVN